MNDDSVLRLIAAIYDAAETSEGWDSLVAELSNALGASSGMLQLRNKASYESVLSSAWQVDPEAISDYLGHFHQVDYWAAAATKLREGTVFTGSDLLPVKEQRTTEFFNDFLLPNNSCHMLATITFSGSDWFGDIAFYRSQKDQAFEAEERRLLSVLGPHMQRATYLSAKLGNMHQGFDAILTTLDRIRTGVVMLDDRLRIVAMNRSAKAILDVGDSIRVSHGNFCASKSSETEHLQRLVATAAGSMTGVCFETGGSMTIDRKFGGRPHYITVVPLPRNVDRLLTSRVAVAVFITDPERQPKLPSGALQQIFQLTPAEARFAEAFVQETNLQATAHRLSITEGSARIYLKRVFEKAGVNSQASLVKLLLSSVCVERPIPDGHAEGDPDV